MDNLIQISTDCYVSITRRALAIGHIVFSKKCRLRSFLKKQSDPEVEEQSDLEEQSDQGLHCLSYGWSFGGI